MRTPTSRFRLTAFFWLVVIGLGTVGSIYYTKWVLEYRRQANVQMQALEDEFRKQWDKALDTCADSPSIDTYVERVSLLYQPQFANRLKHIDQIYKEKHVRIDLALDSFSGYCVFRSEEFQRTLADQKVRVHLIDDKAVYSERIQTIQSGKTPLAVFTVDALINNSARFDNPPAVIVMMIDESQGADAMVAYKDALPNRQALNKENVKIVLTPDSPSEMLARLARSQYNLKDLPNECFIRAEGAEDVYARFKKASPSEPTAYVLWEPFASQLLHEYPDKVHKLIDSADPKCVGYIVDVLVAQKDFLEKNRKEVQSIVKAYLRAAAVHQKAAGGMVKLVQADSAKLHHEFASPEAEKVVQGIRWKNTQDNYSHFGLAMGSVVEQPLEETIKKITTVLLETGAMSRIPKQPLVDQSVLADLQKENFDEAVVPDRIFDPLKDWAKLKPVRIEQPEPIYFKPADDTLLRISIDKLGDVAATMQWRTDYYLQIEGSTKSPADADLAQRRAEEVLKWLRDTGHIEETRMKAQTVSEAAGNRVTFVFLEQPR